MDSICKHPHFSHFQFDAAQASSSEVFRPGDPWPGFPAGTSSPHRWKVTMAGFVGDKSVDRPG